MLEKKYILSKTGDGLHIYAHILSIYYPDRIVLVQSGNACKTARNPFNDHKLSLNIRNSEQMYFYQDTELAEFKGDVFDFAALHYRLTDQELLQKINQDMQLLAGVNSIAYKVLDDSAPEPELTNISPRFSFFRSPVVNTNPSAEISVAEVYKVIKSNRYKERTSVLRNIGDVNKVRKYKAENFDYVTFSGVFTKRSDKCMIKHSGLITLDFDHVPNLPELKSSLLNDSYFETVLMFTSPSGTGLKWIVAIDLERYTHLDWFNGIAAYIRMKYNLEVDKSGKDVSRACFLPWDPEMYINPKYIL